VNPAADARTDLVRACLREPVTRTPVWFMRQAGRSLPEYRAARGEGSILSAIADPSLAAELTLQPVRRYGVDAAILFSDIVEPLHAIGFGVEVEAGRGPVVAEPFRGEADLARLRAFEPAADAPYVGETVRLVARELTTSGVALIGFAGAPFTVASYIVEGGPSRTFAKVKALMHGDPGLWARLTDRLAAMAVASGKARDLPNLGQAAFQEPDGSVVVRKDWKVLVVDITGLPAQFGVPPTSSGDVAVTVADVILGCWAGD